jgi:16S rRNA (guanine527-N7)-methyltransferase
VIPLGKLTNTLKKGFDEVGIEISDKQVEQFDSYFNLLIEWNQKFNLTSITDDEEVAIKHFIDSVIPGHFYPVGEKIIDVGTGAGFPGIPLKIMFPHIELVLLDSLQKRINFLNQVVSQLELNNVTVIHGRAEDYGQSAQYREKFSFCCSRAVARLSILSEYCLPFIKKGGLFLAYKGPNALVEVEQGKNALKLLGGQVKEIKTFKLPITGEERNLVVIEKITNTPSSYPRKAGLPEKKPLE